MNFLQILTLFDGKMGSALSGLWVYAEKETLSVGSGTRPMSLAVGEGVVD
jgi:hypothetical protein